MAGSGLRVSRAEPFLLAGGLPVARFYCVLRQAFVQILKQWPDMQGCDPAPKLEYREISQQNRQKSHFTRIAVPGRSLGQQRISPIDERPQEDLTGPF
jgi:hypothetical protein